jgi:transmembrane sensor
MSLFSRGTRDWTDLAAYLAGELSADERARFERELAADPERAAALEQARTVYEAAGRPADDWDAAGALARIKAQAAEPVAVEIRPIRAQVATGWSGLTTATAAGLLVAAGVWYAGRAPSIAAPGNPPMAEITTSPGERAELLLPDGSRVTLGMASRLRYPVEYTAGSRDLYLEGEAYFEVVSDSTRPFRVHTRRGVTEDLGTAFDVRAYGASPLAVVVTEGSALLRATSNDTVFLGPGDLGRVGSDGKVTRTVGVDVESWLAWRHDRLVFRDTPLLEVLDRLRAWYGMDIELGDSTLAARPFTATFGREPPSAVLKELALIGGLRYESRGELTMVYASRTPPAADR